MLDAADDVREMLLDDPVVDAAPALLARQQPAATHQGEMLRGHVAGDLTGVGELTHGVLALQHQLDHPQPVGVRDRAQAFCRLGEHVEAERRRGPPGAAGVACRSRHYI